MGYAAWEFGRLKLERQPSGLRGDGSPYPERWQLLWRRAKVVPDLFDSLGDGLMRAAQYLAMRLTKRCPNCGHSIMAIDDIAKHV